MRYVATDADGVWVGVVGFGSAALACRPRDEFVGWSSELQFRRLRYVTSNQRFCVLPAGRRQNAASAVMARTLARLSSDWVRVWGHPVVLVETFVDPARHVGTCYAASSFTRLGTTAGFGRRSGRYYAHGNVKDVYVKALHRRAVSMLAAPFDHPFLTDQEMLLSRLDFNTCDLSSLMERLDLLVDPRQARGIRHSLTTTLTLIACATLAGHKSLVAISEWCHDVPQQVLERVGARVSPSSGQRIAPSYATIRRALMSIDADAFDLIVNTWASEQATRKPQPPQDDRTSSGDSGRGGSLVGVAVDGKTMRGARRNDGTRTQLLAAMRHDLGMVIGQRNVDNDKTNEIKAFVPLLAPLNIAGMVITADAMHTQHQAANTVAAKDAHYIFGVKANQPTMHTAALAAADNVDLDRPEFETEQRGHGRIDRHRIWTATIPAPIRFPNAQRFVIVERESADLDDRRTSIETRVYITDLTSDQADAANLHRLITGHWTIENSLHWVRDVTYDEDRSQVRTGTTPRILATLRNLAISIIRYTTHRTVSIAQATRQLARQPETTLDLLGIPA